MQPRLRIRRPCSDCMGTTLSATQSWRSGTCCKHRANSERLQCRRAQLENLAALALKLPTSSDEHSSRVPQIIEMENIQNLSHTFKVQDKSKNATACILIQLSNSGLTQSRLRCRHLRFLRQGTRAWRRRSGSMRTKSCWRSGQSIYSFFRSHCYKSRKSLSYLGFGSSRCAWADFFASACWACL